MFSPTADAVGCCQGNCKRAYIGINRSPSALGKAGFCAGVWLDLLDNESQIHGGCGFMRKSVGMILSARSFNELH